MGVKNFKCKELNSKSKPNILFFWLNVWYGYTVNIRFEVTTNTKVSVEIVNSPNLWQASDIQIALFDGITARSGIRDLDHLILEFQTVKELH